MTRKPTPAFKDFTSLLGDYVKRSGVGERREREIEANPIAPVYIEAQIRDPRTYRLTAQGREIRYGNTEAA